MGDYGYAVLESAHRADCLFAVFEHEFLDGPFDKLVSGSLQYSVFQVPKFHPAFLLSASALQ